MSSNPAIPQGRNLCYNAENKREAKREAVAGGCKHVLENPALGKAEKH